jgi:hypothetical protein
MTPLGGLEMQMHGRAAFSLLALGLAIAASAGAFVKWNCESRSGPSGLHGGRPDRQLSFSEYTEDEQSNKDLRRVASKSGFALAKVLKERIDDRWGADELMVATLFTDDITDAQGVKYHVVIDLNLARNRDKRFLNISIAYGKVDRAPRTCSWYINDESKGRFRFWLGRIAIDDSSRIVLPVEWNGDLNSIVIQLSPDGSAKASAEGWGGDPKNFQVGWNPVRNKVSVPRTPRPPSIPD